MDTQHFSISTESIKVANADGSPLAAFGLSFVLGGKVHRVTGLEKRENGWLGRFEDRDFSLTIDQAAKHLCVELHGPSSRGLDITYFHGSTVAASHAHAFIPDENLGIFSAQSDKTFTLTNQGAMRRRLGVKEELWMLAPQPHVFGLGDSSGRGFSFSIPECLPSDAALFVLRDKGFQLQFIHYVAACDGGRFPRVYIDLEIESRREALARHVGHAHELGLIVDKPEQPHWWHNPLYCTWGDQCRLGQHGVAKDATLTAERILDWADKIRKFYDGEVNFIIDDGYFIGMGDFRLRPELYPSVESFQKLIAELKRRNFRVILWYTPFWVDKHAAIVREHPEWLLRGANGKLLDDTGDWKGKYHFDWTHPAVREHQRKLIAHFLTELDADGFKIDMTYANPPTREVIPHDPSWAAGNLLCKRVIEFIHGEATAIRPDVFLTVNGVESYLQPFASAVRLNDLFNFTDGSAWYRRAELVADVMPGMAIDVDGWPGATAKLRSYPFAASVFGAPVVYYLDGTEAGDITFGEAETNRTAAIWNTYRHAPVESGQKITFNIEAKTFERRDANGALRAVSYAESIFIAFNKTARVAVNKDTAVSVPLENSATFKTAECVRRDGSRSPVPLHQQEGRVLFFAEDSAKGILYYELSA